MKRIFLFLMTSLIVFLLFFAWFKVVDFHQTMNNFKYIKVLPALLGVIFSLTAHILRSLRLKVILSSFKRIALFTVFKIYMASAFINMFLPVRQLGIAADVLLLRGVGKIEVSKSLSAVLVSRVADMMVLFFILAFLPFFPFRLNVYIRNALGIIAILFFFVLIVVLFLSSKGEYGRKTLERAFFFIPSSIKKIIFDFADSFVKGLQTLKGRRRTLVIVLFLSFLMLFSDALSGLFIARSFGLKIPLLVMLFGQSLIDALSSFPSPPLQAGSFEWYVTAIFHYGFGYPINIVSSLVIFSHLAFTLIVVVLGSISLSLLGIDLKELFKGKEKRREGRGSPRSMVNSPEKVEKIVDSGV